MTTEALDVETLRHFRDDQVLRPLPGPGGPRLAVPDGTAPPAIRPRLRPLPEPGGPRAGISAPAPRAVAAAKPVARRGVALPVHVAVAAGAAVGIYAASLAGVATLQALTNAQLDSQSAPALAAIASMRDQHDRLEAALNLASAQYTNAATAYQSVVNDVQVGEQRLAGLGKQVVGIEQAESALTSARSAIAAASSSVGSGYVATGGSKLLTITKTVYVSAKPVSNACTTASGKPC